MKRKRDREHPPTSTAPGSPASTPGSAPVRHHWDVLQVQRAATRAFKDWKRQLCRLVETQSTMEITPEGQFIFILPTAIVRLVWLTSLKERIAMEKRERGQKDAVKRAVSGIRQELEEATMEVLSRLPSGTTKPPAPGAASGEPSPASSQPPDPIQDRYAEVRVGDQWERREFEAVKKGDVFRIFEGDGTVTDNGATFRAAEDAKQDEKTGVWGISAERAVDDLPPTLAHIRRAGAALRRVGMQVRAGLTSLDNPPQELVGMTLLHHKLQAPVLVRSVDAEGVVAQVRGESAEADGPLTRYPWADLIRPEEDAPAVPQEASLATATKPESIKALADLAGIPADFKVDDAGNPVLPTSAENDKCIEQQIIDRLKAVSEPPPQDIVPPEGDEEPPASALDPESREASEAAMVDDPAKE